MYACMYCSSIDMYLPKVLNIDYRKRISINITLFTGNINVGHVS